MRSLHIRRMVCPSIWNSSSVFLRSTLKLYCEGKREKDGLGARTDRGLKVRTLGLLILAASALQAGRQVGPEAGALRSAAPETPGVCKMQCLQGSPRCRGWSAGHAGLEGCEPLSRAEVVNEAGALLRGEGLGGRGAQRAQKARPGTR